MFKYLLFSKKYKAPLFRLSLTCFMFFQSSCTALSGLNNASTIRELLSEGIEHNEQGDKQKAIASFKKIIEISPSDHNAYVRLFGLYSDLNQTEEALAVIDKAIQHAPTNTFRLEAEGQKYMMLKDYEKALATLQQVAEEKPEHVGVMSDIALSYYSLEDYDKALETYLKIIDNTSDEEQLRTAYVYLGSIHFELKDYEESIKSFQKVLEEDENDGYALYMSASANIELERYSDAEKHSLKALKNEDYLRKNPDREVILRYYLGASYFMQKKYTLAIEQLSQVGDKNNAKDLLARSLAAISSKLDVTAENPSDDISDTYLQDFAETFHFAKRNYQKNAFPGGTIRCFSKETTYFESNQIQSNIKEYLESKLIYDEKDLTLERFIYEYQNQQHQPYLLTVKVKLAQDKPFNLLNKIILESLEKSVFTALINGVFCEFHDSYEIENRPYRQSDSFVFTNSIPNYILEKYGLQLNSDNGPSSGQVYINNR